MKKAYIMRGVPGSGKSTRAKEIASAYSNSAIHSTDDLFAVGGEYRFDPSKLGEYHAENLRRFVGSLKSDVECVILDNTNSQLWEYDRYIRAAELHGYIVEIVRMPMVPAEVSFYLNTHGVPLASIQAMIARWEP